MQFKHDEIHTASYNPSYAYTKHDSKHWRPEHLYVGNKTRILWNENPMQVRSNCKAQFWWTQRTMRGSLYKSWQRSCLQTGCLFKIGVDMVTGEMISILIQAVKIRYATFSLRKFPVKACMCCTSRSRCKCHLKPLPRIQTSGTAGKLLPTR